jgi:processive 1,2-diacylglycerol beta-glucosyltransferase
MRILVATVTAGGGHLKAAAALKEAWKTTYPSDDVKRVDLLDLVPKVQRNFYVDGYVKLVEHAPELYGLFFNKTDNPKRLRELAAFRRSFAKHTNRKCVRFLREFEPQAVLCTHFRPLEVLGAVKSKRVARAASPFTVCIVTDFEAHALWMEPAVDLYCVATEETKARLVAPAILASGWPLPGFPSGGILGGGAG